jgi:hypothetical protein
MGKGTIQLETYLHIDDITLQHWVLFGFGPWSWLDVSIGLVHGRVQDNTAVSYSAAVPLAQAKLHLLESETGAAALVLGLGSPWGSGGLQTNGWSGFSYLALSKPVVSEVLKLHGNIGLWASRDIPQRSASPTWGVAAVVRAWKQGHLFVELVSGDVYTINPGGALQTGIIIEPADNLHLDLTVGKGLWGSEPLALWWTVGLKWSYALFGSDTPSEQPRPLEAELDSPPPE